jgi:hypothetical protein
MSPAEAKARFLSAASEASLSGIVRENPRGALATAFAAGLVSAAAPGADRLFRRLASVFLSPLLEKFREEGPSR